MQKVYVFFSSVASFIILFLSALPSIIVVLSCLLSVKSLFFWDVKGEKREELNAGLSHKVQAISEKK